MEADDKIAEGKIKLCIKWSKDSLESSYGNTRESDEDDKVAEGKDKLPIKRYKGILGCINVITGKKPKGGKTSGASANGGLFKSVDTQSEESNDGSEANSEDDSPHKSRCKLELLEESIQNGGSGPNGRLSTHRTMMNQTMAMVPIRAPGVPNLTTNSCGVRKTSHAPIAGGMVAAGSQENLQPHLWMRDERKLKRQRRKQSNRESARRSRLRKQAECDKLAHLTEVLKDENWNLMLELEYIRNEYKHLLTQNASLKERLGEAHEKSE